MCIWDLQCFQSFPNCNLFCTFFLLRNFFSGDAPHGNYGKHCLSHHFQRCAHGVDQIYSIFKVFEIAFCFAHLFFGYLNSADSHHASYGERCLNQYFQHCSQCVYEIYTIFKVCEIAVCFAHFGLFEISTLVMSNMLTMENIVWMIITNIAHTVHIWF